MAAGKGVTAERDAAVLAVLEGIKAQVARIETTLATVSLDLANVRIADLSAIRANLNDVASELRDKVTKLEASLRERIFQVDSNVQILTYQAKRSGAFAGAWISAAISVLVGALSALLIRR